jgi:NADP-dependent 3-hydroxy acid dehydrogenase YdfG
MRDRIAAVRTPGDAWAMLLTNKNAVIYGAGGAIGTAVARAFASEGAKVFLTGRHLKSLEALAMDIVGAAAQPKQLLSTLSTSKRSRTT